LKVGLLKQAIAPTQLLTDDAIQRLLGQLMVLNSKGQNSSAPLAIELISESLAALKQLIDSQFAGFGSRGTIGKRNALARLF